MRMDFLLNSSPSIDTGLDIDKRTCPKSNLVFLLKLPEPFNNLKIDSCLFHSLAPAKDAGLKWKGGMCQPAKPPSDYLQYAY